MRTVFDAMDLVPGDVVELATPGAWRIVTAVSEATHPVAGMYGAVRVETLTWVGRRPSVVTWWPRLSWRHVGKLAELEPAAV